MTSILSIKVIHGPVFIPTSSAYKIRGFLIQSIFVSEIHVYWCLRMIIPVGNYHSSLFGLGVGYATVSVVPARMKVLRLAFATLNRRSDLSQKDSEVSESYGTK